MNELKTLNRRLPRKSKLIILLFVLMTLGLITFLVSPFLLIWVSWDLAWRVGATGLCSTVSLFLAWWLTYNSLYATLKAIRNE